MRETQPVRGGEGLVRILSLYFFLISFFHLSVCQGQAPTLSAVAVCYDDCGAAVSIGQQIGFVPELCGKNSDFEGQMVICQDCLDTNGVNANPDLVPYLDYCQEQNSSNTVESAQDRTRDNQTKITEHAASTEPTPDPTSASTDRSFDDDRRMTRELVPSDAQTFASTLPTPTGRPCQHFFCDNALENWLVFVKYRNVFETETGCRNISNRNEMHVLEDCASIPRCLTVPQNVTDLMRHCKAILAQIPRTITPTTIVTATTMSNAPPTLSTTTFKASITVAADSQRSASAAAAARQQAQDAKSNTLKNIAIIAAIGALFIISTGFGTYILCKKKMSKGLQPLPDLPSPSLYPVKSLRTTRGYSQPRRGRSRSLPSPVEMGSRPMPVHIRPIQRSFAVELEGDNSWDMIKRGHSYYKKEGVWHSLKDRLKS